VATVNALDGNMRGPSVATGAVVGLTERGADKVMDRLHIPYDKALSRRRIAALGVHPDDTIGNMLIKQVPQVVMDIAHNNYGPPGTKQVPIFPEVKKNIQSDPVGTGLAAENTIGTLIDGFGGLRDGISTAARAPHFDPESLPDKATFPSEPHNGGDP
jgi:hypothetical protein